MTENTKAIPASTSVSGFAIRIDAFLPVNTKDLDSQISASTAVKTALETNDITPLLALINIQEIGQKFVTRRIALVPAVATTQESDGQTDLEDFAEVEDVSDASDDDDASGDDNAEGSLHSDPDFDEVEPYHSEADEGREEEHADLVEPSSTTKRRGKK